MKLAILVVILLTLLAMPAFSDCQVSSLSKETTEGFRYDWSVHFNDVEYYSDEAIKYFFVEVPLTTKVLSYVVPLPYAGDPSDVWNFSEIVTGTYHDSIKICEIPKLGNKWLVYSGNYIDSLYPRGTTVTFEVTTDKSTVPGITMTNTTWLNPWDQGIKKPYFTSEYHSSIGPINIVPESSSLLALGGGLVTLINIRRKQK